MTPASIRAIYDFPSEWTGQGETPVLHKEHLTYEFVELKSRSYK